MCFFNALWSSISRKKNYLFALHKSFSSLVSQQFSIFFFCLRIRRAMLYEARLNANFVFCMATAGI